MKEKRFILGVTIILMLLLTLSGCTMTRQFYGKTLINNSQAKDVSSEELVKFLQADTTEYHPIVTYTNDGNGSLHDFVTSGYECMNFAVDLHNNAEKAGIRCAVVESPDRSHVFNAFDTTDKGIVYTDAWSGTDNLAYTDAIGNVYLDCPVTKGIGDSFTEILGNPENFKVEW